MEGEGTQRTTVCSRSFLSLDMSVVEAIVETSVEPHGVIRSNIKGSAYTIEMQPWNEHRIIESLPEEGNQLYHHFNAFVQDSKSEEG